MTARVALVGCGDWGRNHARALSRFTVLAAVADADADRAGDIATRFGSDVASVDEILADPRIDAVVIAVSPTQHAGLAIRALEAGKHVLVEKPMALDICDAQRICAAAEERGLIAMTGHILRFHPAFETLERMIRAGVLGRVLRAEAQRKGFGKFFPRVGVTWDLAPHDLALLFALTGRPPVSATGRCARVLSDRPDAAEIDLDFGAGFVAHIEVSRVFAGKVRRLTVIGTEATALFDDLAPWPEKLMLTRPGCAPQPVPFPETAPLDAEIRHFLDCIQTGAEPLSSARHGCEVLSLIEGIAMTEVPASDFPDSMISARAATRRITDAS
jgi:predicted dehydrogenase